MANMISTIEQLVSEAVKYANKRFELKYRLDYEYDDQAAGDAWETKRSEMYNSKPPYNTPERGDWQAKYDEFNNTRPPLHAVEYFYLDSDYYRYEVSPELGKMIDAVWTKKQSRYSTSERRIGKMTLAGILKRLGNSDVAKLISEARAKEKHDSEIRQRNRIRADINDYLKKLDEYVTRNGAQIGVTVDMFQLPVELADALKYEELSNATH